MLNKIKYELKKILIKKFRDTEQLKEVKRYTQGSINIFGKPFIYADSLSFYYMYKEIFEKKIYSFNNSNNPYIIDCGANIGLSILFYKLNYNDAEVLAVEADRAIFDILSKNIKAFNLSNVTTINKAVWKENKELDFFSEGADAGRLHNDSNKPNSYKVDTIKLSDLILKRVNLLKIDIEGAEYEVLEEAKDKLHMVDNLFVEYHSFYNKPQQLDKILSIIQYSGFRYYIQNIYDVPAPFINKSVHSEMDMQVNIFAYR
jgi:FkbM family methyltransferase